MIMTASEFWREYVNYVVKEFADYQDDVKLKNAKNFNDFIDRVYDIIQANEYYQKIPDYGYYLILDEEFQSLSCALSDYAPEDGVTPYPLRGLARGLDDFACCAFAIEINKKYFHFNFPLHSGIEILFRKYLEKIKLYESKKYSSEEKAKLNDEINNKYSIMMREAADE